MNALIVYYSCTGNTENMANAIANGIHAVGGTAEVVSVESYANQIEEHDIVLLGCPAMGCEVLEEMVFQPFYDDVKASLVGKTVGLFGTYDWGDGQWMREWTEDALDSGLTLHQGEGLAIHQEDDVATIAMQYGKSLLA